MAMNHPQGQPGQATRPENVGILAMEVYFPKCYVNQSKLEQADGCPGKYTRGLGQLGLSFCDDREDVASIMMTVVRALLDKYRIDPAAIGRLEVGTETLTDKSKSVKTSLMELLGGNSDVEGVTSVNACYGGTAALFNSVAWVESSAWDGRYALVVCGDIAVYEAGPARATSGCGAVAMLVGPDAPLVLEPARSSHCMEVWDFYKPRAGSEYPIVDGKLSQRAYLQSVDTCFLSYRNKAAKHFPAPAAGGPLVGSLESFFDFFCFHSPYHKLAQKGLTRLVYLDFLDHPSRPHYQDVQHLHRSDLSCTYDDRDIDTAFRDKAEPLYRNKLLPAANLPKQIGNCYSASVFMGLASLVHDVGAELVGKRVLMFSYGSGSMASLYTMRGRQPSSCSPASSSSPFFSLARMVEALNLRQRLADRIQCSPQQFEAALSLREQRAGGRDYHPTGMAWPSSAGGLVGGMMMAEGACHVAPLQQGAYYLAGVDGLYRRHYARSSVL